MIMFIVYIIMSSSGIILFKLGSSDLSIKLLNNQLNMNFPFMSILGLLCYVVSFVLWMIIISKSDVHIVVPLGLGLSNILILIGSAVVLKETISPMSVVGFALILVGAIIMQAPR